MENTDSKDKAEITKMKKLNFGCGKKILPEYINVDIVQLPGVDLVINLEKTPYPFRDNEFDEIYADNVIEHLGNFIAIMQELQRILKPGGKLKIKVPHFSSHDAWAHPQHTRAFTYESFDFFVRGTKRYKTDGRCFPKSFRRIKRKKLVFEKGMHPANWHNYIVEAIANIIPKWYEKTPLRMFPASSVEVVMEK